MGNGKAVFITGAAAGIGRATALTFARGSFTVGGYDIDDTTAAVAASGAIAGEDALQIATIVKTTQNALIGVVAIALTAYFALRVERTGETPRPTIGQFWERFPKFVLGSSPPR